MRPGNKARFRGQSPVAFKTNALMMLVTMCQLLAERCGSLIGSYRCGISAGMDSPMNTTFMGSCIYSLIPSYPPGDRAALYPGAWVQEQGAKLAGNV